MASAPNAVNNQFRMGGHMQQFDNQQVKNPYHTNNSFTVGEGGAMSKLKALEPWFGTPQRPTAEQPYQWWETENHDLPDALRGSNAYVLNIIITAMLTSDLTPVTEMLPYRKSEAGLTVKWDEWRFTDSLMDRTPEETTSRLTTNNFNSFSAHMVRRGKAFMLEHGFWMTPMGQKNWAMNIIQVVNSLNETACFQATYEVLNSTPYLDPNQRYRSAQDRTMSDIETIVQRETDNWCRVQKDEGGFDKTMQLMDEEFQARNGHRANYLVLPAGISESVANRPENQYALFNGRGPTSRDAVMAQPQTVRKSRGYRVGEHQPNIDPHYIDAVISGFHVFNNLPISRVPVQEQRTYHRDIGIFSMSVDDIVQMEFAYNLQFTGLYENWNTDRMQLSWIGQQFMKLYNADSWGVLCDAAEERNNVLDKLQYLSDEDYQDLIENLKKSAEGVANLPMFKDAQAELNRPSGDMFQQPLPAGRVVEDGDQVGTAFKEQIMRAHSAPGFHLNFMGNDLAADVVAKDRSVVDVHFVDAQELYNAASLNFVLFRISVKTAPWKTTVTAKGGELRDPRGCVMAELSLMVSVLYATVQHYNSCAHPAATKQQEVLLQYVEHLRGFLNDTPDLSGTIGGEPKLSHVLLSDRWRTLLDTPQISGQQPVSFKRALQHLQTMCDSTASGEDRAKAFKEAITDKAGQTSTGAQFDPLDATTFAAPLQPSLTPAALANYKEDSVAGLEAIRKGAEELILKSAPAAAVATEALKKDYLSRFNVRWELIESHLYQLWVSSKIKPTSSVAKHLAVIGHIAARMPLLDMTMRFLDYMTENALDETRKYFNGQVLGGGDLTKLAAAMKDFSEWSDKAKLTQVVDLSAKATLLSSALVRQMSSRFRSVLANRSANMNTMVAAGFARSTLAETDDTKLEIAMAWAVRGFTRAPQISALNPFLEYLDKSNAEGFGWLCVGEALLKQEEFPVAAARLHGEWMAMKAEMLTKIPIIATPYYARLDLPNAVDTIIQKADAIWVRLSVNAAAPGSSTGSHTRLSRSQFSTLMDNVSLRSGGWLRQSLAKHLPVPLGMIGFRLHKQWEVGTAVMMDAFGAAGYTYFGYADFQLGDDIGKKVHVAHFTCYLKAILQFSKLVVFGRNIICRGYGGGEGTKAWNPLDPDAILDFKNGRSAHDIIYAPVLSSYRQPPLCMDVTGFYAPDLCAQQDSTPQYPSAGIICRVFGLKHMRSSKAAAAGHPKLFMPSTQRNFQTIGLQEHTQTWNHRLGGYEDVIQDRGHWGSRVYPGCGRVRRGEGRYLELPSYIKTKTVTVAAS